jgi:hypothetical protein
MFKKLFGFLVFVSAIVLFWFGFAFWTGLYSVYSIPPSKQHPDGSTLIVSREEGEPLFNSPDRILPPPPKKEQRSTGIGFGLTVKQKRPVPERTIVNLPFIEWAYKKSLEKPDPEETR